MTPEQLKASILQYAIQGKLVEQLPSETLSESISAKALDRNSEDLPFEIPDKWCWCHLENIAILHNGRAYKKAEMLNTGKYPLLRVGNLFTSDTWYYSDMELEPEKYCDNGDLLYAWSASFGPHIWNGGKVIFHYHIWKVELRYPQMRDYLYWALAAQTDAMKRRGHGLAMIHITKAGTEKMLIPVPPLAEQQRIVAKIEELLPYVDRYAVAYEKLEQFNAKFPEDMKKSILQYAVQGKLVEQRPDEGTGEELYRQIQTEKQRLIKEGKIKKEKPLPDIAEDEIPFDIPDTWKWVRLSTIGITQTGNTPSKSHPEYIGIDIPFITPGDILNGQICYSNQALSLLGKNMARVCCAGSIMQVCIGGSIGKAAITDREVTFNQQINVVSPIACVSEYLFAVMQSAYFTTSMKERAGGTATPIINRGLWDALLIPLPPLAEQKRIVAKLEEILPLCERLK